MTSAYAVSMDFSWYTIAVLLGTPKTSGYLQALNTVSNIRGIMHQPSGWTKKHSIGEAVLLPLFAYVAVTLDRKWTLHNTDFPRRCHSDRPCPDRRRQGNLQPSPFSSVWRWTFLPWSLSALFIFQRWRAAGRYAHIPAGDLCSHPSRPMAAYMACKQHDSPTCGASICA